jgi:hypothetical protein
MTRRERAAVVELLRCAADRATATVRPISTTARLLGYPEGSAVFDLAIAARCDVAFAVPFDDEAYRWQILEAAARVEEGTWP